MMYSSPRRRVIHSFPTPPARGRTMHATDHTRALSNSRLAAVYLWLAIAKAVSHCPGRLKLFDAAKTRGAHTHHGGIKQLQLFERRREWRDVTHDKLTVGIGALRLIRSSWVAIRRRAADCCCLLGTITKKILGQYQYHPILASIGQYPNTGIVRTLINSHCPSNLIITVNWLAYIDLIGNLHDVENLQLAWFKLSSPNKPVLQEPGHKALRLQWRKVILKVCLK